MRAVVKFSFLLVLLITTASVATPTHWVEISPGLAYTKISLFSGFHNGYLHAFRVDLSQFELKLAIAEDEKDKIATVQDLTIANHGLLGINGGFFSQELKPLGLRISNHEQRYPLKPISWWGVFYIADGTPHIVNQKQFKNTHGIEFAVQSGPRLIVNGKIPLTLKPGTDSRTAIGINQSKQIILVVTDNLSLSTTQLAKTMAASQIEGGLGCINALNLDGGSSTQLYAKYGNFNLNVAGYSAVTDAILVLPRRSG
jgi:uncharacterized protein YigE (DUF2233 family)